MGRISKIKLIDEEEEDKFGWKQRSRGIGVLPDIEDEEEEEKPFKIVKIKPITANIGFGIGAKGMGGATLPKDTPIIEGLPMSLPKDKPMEDFSTPLGKIQYYKSKIDWLEGIFKEKGEFDWEGSYDAYRYAVEQHNKAVKEYNINLPLIEGLPMSKPEDKFPGFEMVEDTKISAYTPPEKTLWNKVGDLLKGVPKIGGETPEAINARAQVSLNISQQTGIPATTVNQNLDKITKELGIRGIPTTGEFVSEVIKYPIIYAIVTNPVYTTIRIGEFLALTEGINKVGSLMGKWEYKFGAGKGIKDLLPEETNQFAKDVVSVAEFLGKAYLIGKFNKGVASLKLWDKFTKDLTSEYHLPQKVVISAKDAKLVTVDEFSKMGIKGEQVLSAREQGIDIEVPLTEVVKFTDKPWWSSVKGFLGIKPYSEITTMFPKDIATAKPHVFGALGQPATTTLYGGLPVDKIAGEIMKYGKVSAEWVRGLTPDQIALIAKQLTPALASEFLKAVEKPPVVEEVTPIEEPEIKETIISKKPELKGEDIVNTHLIDKSKKVDLKNIAEKLAKDYPIKIQEQKYSNSIVIQHNKYAEPLKGLKVDLFLANIFGKNTYYNITQPEPAKVTPPVEPKEVLKAEIKEPWEMTREEVISKGYIGIDIKTKEYKLIPSQKGNDNNHEAAVAKALSEGKFVPAEVLADYPDLKAEPKPPVIPKELEGLAEEAKVDTRPFAKLLNLDKLANDTYEIKPSDRAKGTHDIFFKGTDKLASKFVNVDIKTAQAVIDNKITDKIRKVFKGEKTFEEGEVKLKETFKEYLTTQATAGKAEPAIPAELEGLAEEALPLLPKGAVLEQKDLREWRQLYIDESKGIIDNDRLQKVKMAIIEWVEYLDNEIGNMTDVVYNEAFIENLKEKTNKLENPKTGLKEIDTVLSYIHSEGNILDYILKLAKKDYSNPEIIEGIQSELNAVRELANQLKYRGIKVTPTQATAGKVTAEPKAVVTPVAEKAISVPTKAEVKAEIFPEVELATPAQIKKAHAIADSKAMISEKGKMKPQYRKIAEVFTGKKSIKDMTPEEAEMFIDQLNRLPEPKYRNGQLVPPSMPRTTKLTTEGFFQKKYGEPTPIWLLTDQTYYATKLGIKPLVEPFEKGKQEFDLEFRKSSNLVDRMVNKLNQVAKTSMGNRIKSKVKNIPTKAESNMAELVNKHEATPSGLSPKEEDIFKYFRNLSKDIWRRENEIREKVDLPPIKYKTAYFRHTADTMAKEMLEGKYPFPQGIKYWGEKMVGKKIFNPMEFHRKLSDDLIDIWSKDIRAVTKAMLWNGLKEIHLAEPAKFLNEQLNAISKDLPEYKNLTPRERAAYDQTRVIPASTKKYLINYINQVLKGQETELDASLNRIITKSGLKGIFDKVLSPFGRVVGRTPITNFFVLSGRAVISGVMGWVPRQIMRNSFQPVQNLALYGVKATIKAYLPASVDKNLKELVSESLFLKSYTGYEELPADLMGKLEKVWLGPYGIVATNNAKLGMKAAYWNILELIKDPKFKKHGWADPQRTKGTPRGFLYPSEKEKLSKEMEFGSSCTQYQYIPIGMPGVFRYKALIPLTRLQSWWMNYFTKFLREAIHRGLKGRPSWSGEDGPTFPWSRRVNFLKYVIIGGAILTSLGYRKSFLLGVAPTYLSPAGQLALGMYNYATATEDWQKKRALNQIYYSWKAFIPGSLAWRDFLSVWNGEKDLEEILFYGKKEEEKIQPKTIGKPSISKISIPKISIGKIKRISPVKSKF